MNGKRNGITPRLVEYECERQGSVFYQVMTTKADFVLFCPICRSTRIVPTGRHFTPPKGTA